MLHNASSEFLLNVIQNIIMCVVVYLFILIRGDSNELGLFEDVSSERAAWQRIEIIGLNQMKSRLVFVHGVQNSLQNRKKMF